MLLLRKCLATSLTILTALSGSAAAQDRHVVDPAAVAAAVTQHVASQDTDRAAVREALSRPEVREMASRAGIDLDRATAAVNALSGAELERAASAARDVSHSLTGGASTVTLSTTMIIIGLLVLILIIVAVK